MPGQGFTRMLGWGLSSISGLCSGRLVGKGSPVQKRITRILNPIDGQHRSAGITYSIGGLGRKVAGEGRQQWQVLTAQDT